jgi:hypothetical protein
MAIHRTGAIGPARRTRHAAPQQREGPPAAAVLPREEGAKAQGKTVDGQVAGRARLGRIKAGRGRRSGSARSARWGSKLSIIGPHPAQGQLGRRHPLTQAAIETTPRAVGRDDAKTPPPVSSAPTISNSARPGPQGARGQRLPADHARCLGSDSGVRWLARAETALCWSGTVRPSRASPTTRRPDDNQRPSPCGGRLCFART